MGILLRAATGKFDIFVTLDQNLPFQQRLKGYDLAVLVLRARSSRMAHLRPLIPELLDKLPVAPRGEATVVGA